MVHLSAELPSCVEENVAHLCRTNIIVCFRPKSKSSSFRNQTIPDTMFCSTLSSIQNETLTLTNPRMSYLPWAILDGALLVAILCGNTLTICAVRCCQRLSSLLSCHFVLSLAISDLLVGLTLPYHMAFYLCDGLGEHEGTCLLRFVLILLACCASMCNLIVIAVDRYISIVHPLHYCRYMTRRVAIIMVTTGWITAVIIATVPIYWNQWATASSCDIYEVLSRYYITAILTPAFVLIWAVMSVVYWRIWREASVHVKRMRMASNLHKVPSDWKSTQVVLLVMGSFSVCWLPFFVIACFQAVGVRTPESSVGYKAAFSLAMANSCMNPIIYAWKNSDFKRAFAHLLCCRMPKLIHPGPVMHRDSLKANSNNDSCSQEEQQQSQM